MSRSWADQIEAEDQDRDEGQVHEDHDPGAVEGEERPTAEGPTTTRSRTRMPARAASRTRERTAESRSPVAGGMQSGAAGGGARVVTTEPIDLWVDPILRLCTRSCSNKHTHTQTVVARAEEGVRDAGQRARGLRP
jgi:hypothetical protein